MPCTRDFSRALSELHVIARNCDWFMELSAPVVIGRSNCFGFFDSHLKTALKRLQGLLFEPWPIIIRCEKRLPPKTSASHSLYWGILNLVNSFSIPKFRVLVRCGRNTAIGKLLYRYIGDNKTVKLPECSCALTWYAKCSSPRRSLP